MKTCRYKRRVGLGSSRAVSQELFGVEFFHDMVDIPCRLQYLVSHIPEEFGITIDYLVGPTTPLLLAFSCSLDVHKCIASNGGAVLQRESFLHFLS